MNFATQAQCLISTTCPAPARRAVQDLRNRPIRLPQSLYDGSESILPGCGSLEGPYNFCRRSGRVSWRLAVLRLAREATTLSKKHSRRDPDQSQPLAERWPLRGGAAATAARAGEQAHPCPCLCPVPFRSISELPPRRALLYVPGDVRPKMSLSNMPSQRLEELCCERLLQCCPRTSWHALWLQATASARSARQHPWRWTWCAWTSRMRWPPTGRPKHATQQPR